ncbi:unnamed protein product [Tetraodon nigroviridis]|uniref:(spotted green pufferfish) hypothetical protein n=1 Tax=Tetraodon nigroviridis TaxID=99883 RepID=Q4TBC3_TETNG|nr:unnamed protein product [Tetraodon nigroviridis]
MKMIRRLHPTQTERSRIAAACKVLAKVFRERGEKNLRQTEGGGEGVPVAVCRAFDLATVVKEARRTLKKPKVEKFDFTEHKKTFWCYCCELEVERNVTDGNMTVLHGGLIEHMATPEHRKNTHKFWWENKADPKSRDKFIFTEEESARFKTEVAEALESFVEKEDEFIKQDSSNSGNVHTEEQEKLRKLPPNRVGANFDHSSHTDANWLPSFGRVWNSGRRWQSRWDNGSFYYI